MENIVKTMTLYKTSQELYQVINDKCPICGKEFAGLHNIVKLGAVAYDMECYFRVVGDGIKLK